MTVTSRFELVDFQSCRYGPKYHAVRVDIHNYYYYDSKLS